MTASARSACSSGRASIICRRRKRSSRPGKLGKVTLARTWWHGNTRHLMKVPEKYRTKPSDLDWAHFLGR